MSAAGPPTNQAHLRYRPDIDGLRALVSHDVPFTDLEVRPTSLEEAFLTITHDEPALSVAA